MRTSWGICRTAGCRRGVLDVVEGDRPSGMLYEYPAERDGRARQPHTGDRSNRAGGETRGDERATRADHGLRTV